MSRCGSCDLYWSEGKNNHGVECGGNLGVEECADNLQRLIACLRRDGGSRKVNNLVYISAGLHFEVRNSKVYGGDGTVGYIATKLEGISFDKVNDDLVDKQIESVARMMLVSADNVKLISKEDYDLATDEDEGIDADITGDMFGIGGEEW